MGAEHTLVHRLEGGYWCICQTVVPSEDERDMYIHIEYELRRQLSTTEAALAESRGRIAEIREWAMANERRGWGR